MHHLVRADEDVGREVTMSAYSDHVTRTIECTSFWHAMGSTFVEATVIFHYPDAPDEPVRVRIAHVLRPTDAAFDGWWVFILDAAGNVKQHSPINPEVVERLRPHLVDGALTAAWVEAFYA